MAVANYVESHGKFPPAYLLGPDGRPWHSWRVLILPFIEEQKLHAEYRMDEPWDGPNNRRLADRMPRTYAFSGTEPLGTTTNYLAVVGERTMWPPRQPRYRHAIPDGPGDTVLIVENLGLGVHWMEPRDLLFDTMPMAVNDPAGVSSWFTHPAVVTVDATVRSVWQGLSPEALRAVLTVDGGESVGDGPGGWTVLPDGRLRDRAAPPAGRGTGRGP